MNPNMAFYAVNTKIQSKKGSITDSRFWDKLVESNSIEQLSDLLKNNKEFGKIFNDISVDGSRRVNLETAISRFRKIEIEILLHYFSGNYKMFLKTFLMEEEINDLSLILRKLSRGESLEGIKDRFIHSDEFKTLDFDELLTANSVEQCIRKLDGTLYYNGLKNLTSEDALKREFHIEMKAYAVLYNTLLTAANDLDKQDVKEAKEVIGLKVDLLNIQWIFRALKYYKIMPEEILIYSLDGGSNINYGRLKNLCYSKSLDEFKQLVKNYLGFDLFKDLHDTEIDINSATGSYMFNYLKKKSYHGIGVVISFIYIVDIIINDLTSLTEAMKYGVPKDKLKGYLAYKI